MSDIITFLATAQDYFCFVAIVMWAAALGIRWKQRRGEAESQGGAWLMGTAVAGLGVAMVEWWMFATPVTKTYLEPPHRVGDLLLGFALVAQPIGWVWSARLRNRGLVWGVVGVLLVAAGWRWEERQAGNLLLAAATWWLVPVVWSSARRGVERVSLLVGGCWRCR
ncbi:MAG: hypothetical protein J6386_20830 [Candidatus Synoicihabitans palmerolidicus]|nr:hypothetical protein [Candidatus Synoicihabitans palmerolidicus]